MSFPIVPENLGDLSSTELGNLLKEIKAEHTRRNGTYTAEQRAEAATAAADVKRIKGELTTRQAEQESFQSDVDELEGLDLEDETPEDPDPEDPEPEDGDDDAAAQGEPEPEPEPEDEGKHLAAVTAKPRTRPAQFGLTGSQPVPTPTPTPEIEPTGFQSTGAGQLASGAQFADWADVVGELMYVGKHMSPTSPRREVAVFNANYDADHTLSENDAFTNVEKLRRMRTFAADGMSPEEITAAFCAPATPYYNLGCRNTDRRPVFGSMPRFAAPRGTVTIYPSPTLEDITGGYGIWDVDDENDPNATKVACQTIDCAESDQFWLYGVYRCLTVRNLLQMTFPELVEAYLNRLAAAQARLAERQLLNAMGARATSVDMPPWINDGPVNIVTGLLHALTLHQESQRWDTMGGTMHAWIPRWVMHAMRISLARRRNTNASGVRIPSEAEVSALFSNIGFNVTWFIDTPTWAPTIPPVQAAGDLRLLPTAVPVLFAPEGKFAVMDRGDLNIGVAPGNLYRDNASNTRNEFTLFFESFEGLVDTDSCPAYLANFTGLCWNGVQVADKEAGDCDGTAEGS